MPWRQPVYSATPQEKQVEYYLAMLTVAAIVLWYVFRKQDLVVLHG